MFEKCDRDCLHFDKQQNPEDSKDVKALCENDIYGYEGVIGGINMAFEIFVTDLKEEKQEELAKFFNYKSAKEMIKEENWDTIPFDVIEWDR